MRFLTAFKYDTLSQYRHGFYFVYCVITILYIFLLRSINPDLSNKLTTIIIFTDTGVLGFFFIGGIIFLEKGQNTIESLMVTPLTVNEFMMSKVLSLTFLSVLFSSIIFFSVHFLRENMFLFFVGTILSSILFTIIGLIFSAKSKDISGYFIKSIIFSLLVYAPIIDFLGIFRSRFFLLFPSTPILKLLDAPFSGISVSMLIYSIFSLIIWIAIAFNFARKLFVRYIVYRVGA